MLSTAAVVNNSSIRLAGQTVFSASYLLMTLLAVSVVIDRSLSYDMHRPRF